MKEDEKSIPIESVLYVVKKFQKVGFEGLKDEDLAIAISVQEFKDTFLKQTGVDWGRKYEVKALDRLRKAHFNLQWMTSQRREEYVPLFLYVQRGDLAKTKEFLRGCSDIEDAREAVDSNCRSPLHIAAKEGHSSLVEYLLLQGFSVFARDKSLKTPLHDAAYNGQEYICEQLIKKGALVDSSDSKGRTAFHYACSGSSSKIIILFIGVCPEIVESEDMGQLRGLHYAILNSSLKQVEIVRALLEYGTDVNSRDKEGKTPLYYAAEAGRTRVIPLLMQKGADISLANYENHKTPLDIAANDHTRELLIVYGTPAASVAAKKEDIQWMDTAIKGQGLGFVKEVPFNGSKNGEKNSKKNQKLRDEDGSIQGWVRERFFSMLKKVQEEGVKANQHLKKPYIYTGSWMENVTTVEELYEFLQNLTGSESCLCSFNILCPFDKPLPNEEEKEVIDNFFGDAWQVSIKKPMEERLRKELETQEKLQKLNEIEMKLDYKDKILKDKIEELKKLRQENIDLKVQIQENEGLPKGGGVSNLADVQELEDQITKLKADLKEKSRQLVEKDMELELARLEGGNNNGGAGTLEEGQQDAMRELIQLKEEMRQLKMETKMQRYKTGQIFLKALQENKKVKGKKESDQFNVENLQDDESIINMYMALRNNPPSFIQRLKDVDKDGDNKLTQQEFVKYCAGLGLPSQDVIGLQRIAGFFDGKPLLGIAEFKNILENRPKQRQIWEERLFRKVIDAVKNKNLSIEKFFELIDTDGSGELTPQELREGFENMKIILNQKDFNSLFCIFDKDKNNSISLVEIKEALENYLQPNTNAGEEQDQVQGESQSPDDHPQCKEENNIFLQEEEQVDNDVDIINGWLKLQLPTLRGIDAKYKNIFLKISLSGSVESSIFHSTQIYNSFIKVAQKFRFKNTTSSQLGRYIQVQIFSDSNPSEEAYIGEIHFAWKGCLSDPNNWHCNQEFTLLNLSYPQKKAQGFLAVQARFIPQPIQETKVEGQSDQQMQDVQDIEENDTGTQGGSKEYLEQQRKYMELQKKYMKQQEEFMKIQNKQDNNNNKNKNNLRISPSNQSASSKNKLGSSKQIQQSQKSIKNQNIDQEEYGDMSSNIEYLLQSEDYNRSQIVDSDIDFLSEISRQRINSNQSEIKHKGSKDKVNRSMLNKIDDKYAADLRSPTQNSQVYSMNSDIEQLLNTSDKEINSQILNMNSNVNISSNIES